MNNLVIPVSLLLLLLTGIFTIFSSKNISFFFQQVFFLFRRFGRIPSKMHSLQIRTRKKKEKQQSDDGTPLEIDTIENPTLLQQYQSCVLLSPLLWDSAWDSLSFLPASNFSCEEKMEAIVRHCFSDPSNAVCLYRVVCTPAKTPARQVSAM